MRWKRDDEKRKAERFRAKWLPVRVKTHQSKNLERVAVGLAGADPKRMIDRRHEDLAVADLAGARARGDDVDRLAGEVGGDRDFDAKLGQEIHDIFGAAVDFGVALLAAIALDLGDRHAVDADRGQRLAHLVELEGFYDGNNEFHGQAFIFRGVRLVAPWFAPRQVCHLSVQLAQKVCNWKRKTIAAPCPPSLGCEVRSWGFQRILDFFASGAALSAPVGAFWGNEMADQSWFFASQGQQQGPYPEAQLRQFIASRVVTADTLVWTEAMANWQ